MKPGRWGRYWGFRCSDTLWSESGRHASSHRPYPVAGEGLEGSIQLSFLLPVAAYATDGHSSRSSRSSLFIAPLTHQCGAHRDRAGCRRSRAGPPHPTYRSRASSAPLRLSRRGGGPGDARAVRVIANVESRSEVASPWWPAKKEHTKVGGMPPSAVARSSDVIVIEHPLSPSCVPSTPAPRSDRRPADAEPVDCGERALQHDEARITVDPADSAPERKISGRARIRRRLSRC